MNTVAGTPDFPRRTGIARPGQVRRRCLLLAPLLFAAGTANALTVFVGDTPGSACGHPVFASIDAALAGVSGFAAGPHLIKVQRTLTVGGRVENNIGAGLTNLAADVVIEGGYFSSCAAPDAGSVTTVSANQSGARVMVLGHDGGTQRTVTLRNIRLRNGGQTGSAPVSGGNLRVNGNLRVRLDQGSALVSGRASALGGGAFVSAPGGQQALLEIAGGATIDGNTAVAGGGVACSANGRVRMLRGSFNQNVASVEGGGLYLAQTCQGFFLNPDGAGANAFVGNIAGDPADPTIGATVTRGGAILGLARIDITGAFSAPRHSVEFIGNRAQEGGAMYVRGNANRVDVDLRKALFAGNIALDRGGAVFLYDNVRFFMTHDYDGPDCFTLAPNLPGCSGFIQNVAERQAGGLEGAGAVFAESAPMPAGGAMDVTIDRTLFQANQGGRASLIYGASTVILNLRHNIMVENQSNYGLNASYLVETRGGATLAVQYNTILNNTGQRLARLVNGNTLNIVGTIWWNGANRIAFNVAGGAPSIQTGSCLITSSTTDLPNPGTAWQVDPRLDARYRPRGGSPALDVCDNIYFAPAGPGNDFYRQARGLANPWLVGQVAAPGAPGTIFGDNDLGAVEQRDLVFHGGFGFRGSN